MSDLIKQVTPLTRGIIWLVEDEKNTLNPYYSELDYLLNGLLTATLSQAIDMPSRVMVGENFSRSFVVMVANEIKSSDFDNYASLVKDLGPEDNILLIDELNLGEKLTTFTKNIGPYLRVIH
jgi:hypothetical protein